MTDHTEAEKNEIEEGTKVDHSIVEKQETNGQDLLVLQTKKSVNQIFDERFKELGNSSTKSTTIFKVKMGLRKANPAAYNPMLISIGPYHNKSPKYHSMEKYKLLYLQRFLNRKKGIIDVECCIRELENLKNKALMCYDDIDNLDEDIIGKFSEIMLLDGCFLVEFIRECFGIRPKGEEYYQPIIDNEWMIKEVCRDMMVLENQLPFFVLTMLHDMTKCPDEESFLHIVTDMLLYISPKKTSIPQSKIDNAEQIHHLLRVLHMLCCPLEMINYRQRTDASKKKGFCNINISFGKILKRMKRSKEIPYMPNIGRNIPSATELYEAGVSFTGDRDIKFENGLLEIPCFVVADSTETLLRNLIAYEQHSSNVNSYFSDYADIMGQLIKSHKDVHLLRESGIILNDMRDDKAVAKIFNKLGDRVLVGLAGSSYREQHSKLIQHCQNPSTKMMAYWRKWMASLINNYFFSPWAGAATLGAIMLLVLTIIQTVLAFKGGIK